MRPRRRLSRLLRPSAYQRAWRSVERSVIKRRLLDQPEIRELEELRSRCFPQSALVPNEAPWKFLDIDRALDANIRRAQHLGLLQNRGAGGPRRILDLGCGAGYFLFICKIQGHSCLGLDVGDVPLYDEFLSILGIDRIEARIETFGTLAGLQGPFDDITAFGTVFNRTERGWWGDREWTHFLDDMDQHLAQGGRLFIEPNPMGGPADLEPWMSRYTPEVLGAFLRRGAIVNRHGALFPPRTPREDGVSATLLRAYVGAGGPPSALCRRAPLEGRSGQLSAARGVWSRSAPRPGHGTQDGVSRRRARVGAVRGRRMRGVAFCLAGLLLALSSAEVGLRAIHPQEVRLRGYSREGVMVFVPGFRGTYHRPDFVSRIETDSDGLRDREYPAEKAEGTYRILVLGDSLTAGLQVPVEETYPKRLEALLAEMDPSRRLEVVNAGIPGYGTADELRYLEAFGARWKPDLVLLSFFSGNDLGNNLEERGVYYEGEKVQVGRRSLSGWQFRVKALRSRIASRSHLYRFLRGRAGAEQGRTSSDAPFDWETLCAHPGQPGSAGWRITLDLLTRVEEVSRGLGARFAVVTIPSPWQNDPSILASRIDRERLAQGSCDPLLPGRRVCGQASLLGAACIDLLPEFWATGSERLRYWNGDRHFTSSGHERTARVLASFLARRKLIPEPKNSGARLGVSPTMLSEAHPSANPGRSKT